MEDKERKLTEEEQQALAAAEGSDNFPDAKLKARVPLQRTCCHYGYSFKEPSWCFLMSSRYCAHIEVISESPLSEFQKSLKESLLFKIYLKNIEQIIRPVPGQ